MKWITIFVTLVALEVAARANVPTAEELYAEGQAAYDRTDYATAIVKWQTSYQISGESGLLFNLAQALRLSGDCTRAIGTYQKFAATDPDLASEQHKLALDFARELEPTCHATRVDLLPNPQPTVVGGFDRRPGRKLRIAGLVTGGAGAATIVIGLVLGHRAATIADEVTSACAISCDWSVQKSKDAAGRRDATIGYVLDVAGVATIASGAAMYYLGNRSGVTVIPRAEGGAVATWSGSW